MQVTVRDRFLAARGARQTVSRRFGDKPKIRRFFTFRTPAHETRLDAGLHAFATQACGDA
jgi:hypothetical protein